LSRRDDVRAAVRAAMLELLDQKSFKDLTIDEIAKAAGLSRTAFYFYFKSKNEVLAEVAQLVAAELYDETEEWWSGDGTPRESVRSALAKTARTWDHNAALMRAAGEVAGYDSDFALLYRSLTFGFIERATERIQLHQQDGLARTDIDAKALAESLVWMFERNCQVLICTDRRPVDEVVDAMTTIWLHAVYKDGALE